LVLLREAAGGEPMTSEEFVCYFCNAVIPIPDDGWDAQCQACGRWQNMRGQFAYVRGLSAFKDAINEMNELEKFRKRKDKPVTFRYDYQEREQNMNIFFAEAYNSLQQAFEHELPEEQHEHSVEMMIHIARMFLPKNMISSLEAAYWNALMVFHTSVNEQNTLREKLAKGGVGASLMRWRWQMRLKQLDGALAALDQRIRLLENNLSSVHPMRAYRGMKK
jgi:hypothetical protein